MVAALAVLAAGCRDTRTSGPRRDAGMVLPGVDSGVVVEVDAGRDAGPVVPGGEGSLRIVGTASEGRLEIFHDSQWGTICDDLFDEVDALVACRQLGFSGGSSFTAGGGADPIWMDDLACTGTELRLVDCPFPGWAEHNCSHSEDVGVSCF